MGLRRRPLPPIEAIYVDEPSVDPESRLPAAPPLEVVTLETVQTLVKSIVDARPAPVAEPSPRAEIAELSAQVRALAEEVVQLAERLSDRRPASAVVAVSELDVDDPFSWPTEDELARFDYEWRDTP